MSTHKHIDRICAAAAALSLLLAVLFCCGEAWGVQPASRAMGYETRLFDTARVHTIDIVMDGWDSFIETCENEEYAPCAVVVDGEAYQNVGIRAKGNTSLSSVAAMDSDRYSFKVEFDHYKAANTYYGLDKLCLNNIIQDNTYMKDYLTYQMMAGFGVSAPLCSYAWVTVNGEDWGLYLAVEGVEDSFLQRNYGRDAGGLYKPDSTSMGGGPGNGRGFDMEGFMGQRQEDGEAGRPEGGFPSQQFPGGQGGGFDPQHPQDGNMPDAPADGRFPEQGGGGVPDAPEGGQFPGQGNGGVPNAPEGNRFSEQGGGGMPNAPDRGNGGQGPGGGAPGGMGSADVKLQYSDDDPASYANIFDNAKTDVTAADQARLIQALKTLGGENADQAVDVDQVLRYFVVHNFVVNGDSYTGSMVHNYYLYEEDGKLSMLPWDYNLAFGGFQGGGDASSAVNDPIDTPLSASGDGDRPMFDWIVNDGAYLERYHSLFAEFLETADPAAIIAETAALIAPYVERDPTKFCTYEEFETGVAALETFCALRADSVAGQLAGTVPSTSQGQLGDPAALVDASSLTLSDMGSMDNGRGGRGRFTFDKEP
ncbi:MAG: spore coat protein CotH [Clostridiales bacterium]|nr:spore coat protein CotH [Clostridiales bacterium]